MQILDLVREHPDASLDEITDEIPSATADLVERILEQYGDSAAEDTPSEPEETPVVIDGRHAIERRDGIVYEGLSW